MPTTDDSALIPRRAADIIEESLAAFRVLVLQGPRQAGKTTLARMFAERVGGSYVSLDDPDQLRVAAADPRTFVSASGTPLVIDEVQRVGDPLVLAVKVRVDRDNRPGQFLLTGSTNFLTVPSISETLAGRTDIVTLWPLSQGELRGGRDDFVDRAFEEPDGLVRRRGQALDRAEYFRALCAGGYPAAQQLGGRTRGRWFRSYVETVLEREVRLAADIRKAPALTAMIGYCAATTAQELVVTTMAHRLEIDRATGLEYLAWLARVFLVHLVPSWGRNLTAQVVKRQKVYLADTGVAAALVGKNANALQRPTEAAAGPLVETFVANELAKQLTWCETPARMFHFRDSGGPEIDLVLQAADGRVVGIEVKATSTPRHEDFRWLTMLRDRINRIDGQFVAGVVFHTGPYRLPFGDRLYALPICDLWT